MHAAKLRRRRRSRRALPLRAGVALASVPWKRQVISKVFKKRGRRCERYGELREVRAIKGGAREKVTAAERKGEDGEGEG